MTTALLKVMVEGRQEVAHFDFAPRVPPPTDEERALAALRDYDHKKDELRDVPQAAVEVTHALLCAAKDDDPMLPVYVRASGDLGMEKAKVCLIRLEDHPDPRVQLAVIRAMGQLMALDQLPWLASFAAHPDPQFRKEAAVALGKIPHESVLAPLDRFALADPTLKPVTDFGKEKVTLFVHDPNEAKVTRIILLELASDDYEDLVSRIVYVAKPLDDLAKDKTAPVPLRVRAVRVLGMGRLPPVHMTYFQLLADKSEPEEIRFEAIVALGRLHMRGADAVLLEQVGGAEASLKRAAIFALGQIGKGSTLEPMLAFWDQEAGALQPAIHAAALKMAHFDGAILLASAPTQEHTLPEDALFFIDDETLVRGLRANEVAAQLQSPVVEARRDAAILFGLFGPPERAALLAHLANREQVTDIKAIAERGWRRLDRIARSWLPPMP